jgi:hypothetical protein
VCKNTINCLPGALKKNIKKLIILPAECIDQVIYIRLQKILNGLQ